jgi:hypothetical protein
MLAWLLPVVASLLGASPSPIEVETSVTTEARTGATAAVSGPVAARMATVELDPTFKLRGRYRAWGWSALYSPRLTLDVSGEARGATSLHALGLSANGSWAPGTLLSLSQSLSFGYSDFAPRAFESFDGDFYEPQPEASKGFVDSTTDVWAAIELSRRVGLAGGAGFYLSGPLSDSDGALPRLSGPYASVLAGYQLSRRDGLQLRADGSWIAIGGVGSSQRGELAGRWDRSWTRNLESSLGVGLGIGNLAEGRGESRGMLMPTAMTVVTYRSSPARARVLKLVFDGRVAPQASRLTGEVFPRLDAGATAVLTLQERLQLRLRAGSAVPLPGFGAAERVARGVLSASYRFNPEWDVTTGLSSTWQRAPVPIAPHEWLGFAAVRFAWNSERPPPVADFE